MQREGEEEGEGEKPISPQTFSSPQSPETRTPVCFSCWPGPPPLGPAKREEKKDMSHGFTPRISICPQ